MNAVILFLAQNVRISLVHWTRFNEIKCVRKGSLKYAYLVVFGQNRNTIKEALDGIYSSMKKGSDVLGSWFRRFGILKRRIGQTLRADDTKKGKIRFWKKKS